MAQRAALCFRVSEADDDHINILALPVAVYKLRGTLPSPLLSPAKTPIHLGRVERLGIEVAKPFEDSLRVVVRIVERFQ